MPRVAVAYEVRRLQPRQPMAIDSARAFFKNLATHAYVPPLSDAVGTWQFNIEGAGAWTVAVDHGKIQVADGERSRPAERGGRSLTRVSLREDELLRLVHGDGHENLFTAFLRGALVLDGDLPFAQKLRAIFPVPDEWGERA